MKKSVIGFALLISLATSIGTNAYAQDKMTIFCGVTMRFAMVELTERFAETHKVAFEISNGGSGDLVRLIQNSKTGDIFFPGAESFIDQLKKTGEVIETAVVGENKAALVVAKGNPRKVQGLKDLSNPGLNVILARAASGSIGKESEVILENAGLLDDVLDNVLFFTTDSVDLVSAIISGKADVTINWRATAALKENRGHMDIINIPEAKAERLVFGLLKYSKNARLARDFMAFATSPVGKEIFQRHGF